MLHTHQLTFAYPNGLELGFPNIRCEKGAHWLVLGQSGCGKTTLLHLIAGLLRPKSGHITIDDTELSTLHGRKLDRFRGQHIGIVFQQSRFISSLNVLENLLLAQYLAGVRQDKARIQTLLSRLNLGHKLNAPTRELSQGEQQRVAIARALLNRPNLILADEPTAALDDVHCEEVIKLLVGEAQEVGATLLIVTHDQRLKDRFEDCIVLEPVK